MLSKNYIFKFINIGQYCSLPVLNWASQSCNKLVQSSTFAQALHGVTQLHKWFFQNLNCQFRCCIFNTQLSGFPLLWTLSSSCANVIWKILRMQMADLFTVDNFCSPYSLRQQLSNWRSVRSELTQ